MALRMCELRAAHRRKTVECFANQTEVAPQAQSPDWCALALVEQTSQDLMLHSRSETYSVTSSASAPAPRRTVAHPTQQLVLLVAGKGCAHIRPRGMAWRGSCPPCQCHWQYLPVLGSHRNSKHCQWQLPRFNLKPRARRRACHWQPECQPE